MEGEEPLIRAKSQNQSLLSSTINEELIGNHLEEASPSKKGSTEKYADGPEELGEKKSLTAFEAGLALLSAIVGGGIVGIPFSMIQTGIPFGLFLNIVIALAGVYSGYLYLVCKDLSPTYVESLYELGFVTLGTSSIYIQSVLILISGIGCILIYFIVFGEISASIVKSMLEPGTENFFTTKVPYILVLATVMTPISLMKKLNEMKIVSILLFLAIALFILLFLIQLCTMGTIENPDVDYSVYYRFEVGIQLITGFNIIVLAYSYQTNFFPTYNSLGANKNNRTGLMSVVYASILSFVIYVSLGILSIYTFGTGVQADIM